MGLREIKTDENRSAEGELSAERLRELLDYDPQTGEFAWKPQKAGTLTSDGYIQICVDGKRYRAQRLAVLHMTGKWHAKIDVRGKRVHLGYFDTLEEATAARQDAEERFHGPS